MLRNQYEQYRLGDIIIKTICSTCGVTFLDLISTQKTTYLNILRGLCCYIMRDYCIHPDRCARLICRTRQNVINQARKYRQYLQVKDPETMSVYNKIKIELNKYIK